MIVTPYCVIPEAGEPGLKLPADCIGGIYPPITATGVDVEVSAPGLLLVQVHLALPSSMREVSDAIARELQRQIREAVGCCVECGGRDHKLGCGRRGGRGLVLSADRSER